MIQILKCVSSKRVQKLVCFALFCLLCFYFFRLFFDYPCANLIDISFSFVFISFHFKAKQKQANKVKQKQQNKTKQTKIGSHIISGNVFNPRSLRELFPDFEELDSAPPLRTQVRRDHIWYMTETSHTSAPFIPSMVRNDGHYIISLGNLCRWLGEQAEAMDVNIFTGFSASEPIYNSNSNSVIGIATADVGLNKDGSIGDNYERGVAIHAKQIVLSEGSRGSISEDIINHFNLRKNSERQLYAIGLKEVWELSKDADLDQFKNVTQPGTVIHMLGM